jgi:hypothetical protein
MRKGCAGLVVTAAVIAGCGTHHVSMHDAALRYVCGDRCSGVEIELSNVRRADDYATAEISGKPAARIQGGHVLLHEVAGDWLFVDAWSSLGSLTCADVAQQMRVPLPILHQLGVC